MRGAKKYFIFYLDSLTTLTTITLAAEHLAVIGNRTAAFYPRCDMVGFHLFYFEMLATKRTNATLTLIDLALSVIVERADT